MNELKKLQRKKQAMLEELSNRDELTEEQSNKLNELQAEYNELN